MRFENVLTLTAVFSASLPVHLFLHFVGMDDPKLNIYSCYSPSPANSPEPNYQLSDPGPPHDLEQPQSTNLQNTNSDLQENSPQNHQVLSSWGGPTSSSSAPNKKKPPQPQSKQPRSPGLQRKNSRYLFSILVDV